MATAAIARETGVPRSTIRSWLDRRAGVAQSAEAAGLKSAQWGFESPHQHQIPSYAYLLGMYLGDGYIAHVGGTYALRVYLNRRHREIIDHVKRAIHEVLPGLRVGEVHRSDEALTVVTCYSVHWPSVFPQHARAASI
jgi:hypothetical protein